MKTDEREYVTLKEACEITGYTLSTLKKKMRGNVPMLGQGSYPRKEFFDFLRSVKRKSRNESILRNFI